MPLLQNDLHGFKECITPYILQTNLYAVILKGAGRLTSHIYVSSVVREEVRILSHAILLFAHAAVRWKSTEFFQLCTLHDLRFIKHTDALLSSLTFLFVSIFHKNKMQHIEYTLLYRL